MSERRVKIFISYLRKDKEPLITLKTHLLSLAKSVEVLTDDDDVIASSHMDKIDEVLASADIVAFLFVAGFIASDSCIHEWELAKEKNKVRFPIIARACYWESLLNGEDNIKACMPDDKPVMSHEDKDYAWNEVRKEIQRVAEKVNPSVSSRNLFSLYAEMDLKSKDAASTPINTLCNGKPSVGLGILSWKGQVDTLRISLESHRNAGLFKLFNDVVVFFQEIREEDRALAAEFGVRAEGAAENIGTTAGMVKITDLLNTDYILHLEHGTRTVADSVTVRNHLKEAMYYMRVHPVPERHCYLTNDSVLDGLSSGEIPYDKKGIEGHWMLRSGKIPWSSNGALFSREWLENLLLGVKEMAVDDQVRVDGHLDLDATLEKSSWWVEQNFRVGIINEKLFALPSARASAPSAQPAEIIQPSISTGKSADDFGYEMFLNVDTARRRPPVYCITLKSTSQPPTAKDLVSIVFDADLLCDVYLEKGLPPIFRQPQLSGSLDDKIQQVRDWLRLEGGVPCEFDGYCRLVEESGILVVSDYGASHRWGENHLLHEFFAVLAADVRRLEHPNFIALGMRGDRVPLIIVKEKESPEVRTRALFHALGHMLLYSDEPYNTTTPYHVQKAQARENVSKFARGCLLS